MRLAIVSDIHANLTALEAVIADLRETSPDLVLHGGDLVAGGARPAEIIDRVRALGWSGVLGNTDEMLFRPEALNAVAARSPHLKRRFDAIDATAVFTRAALGAGRIEWLEALPIEQRVERVALLHASPESTWIAPGAQSSDAELASTYASLTEPLVVYGHIHHPYVRAIGDRTIVNSGSVSLSYDGDSRASYLLIDEQIPAIRRVAYDMDAECEALASSGIPHASWIAQTLRSASFVMP